MSIVVKENASSHTLEALSNSEVVELVNESETQMLPENIIPINEQTVKDTPDVDTSSYSLDNPIPANTTPKDLGFIRIKKHQIAEYEKVYAPLRYELAGLLHVAGYNVLPCKDGDKYPYVEWEEYTSKRVTDIEIKQWINLRTKAFWIVCGLISGNLQVPDFDQTSEGKRLYNEFASGAKHLIAKYNLHFTNSGSGGKHCFLKVDSNEVYGGSQLSFLHDPRVKGYKCVTETRGEEQGIMMPFSIYKFKRPKEFEDDPTYEDLYGYYWTELTPEAFVKSIALVSEDDFGELKNVAKNLGERPPVTPPYTKPPEDPNGKIIIPGSSEDMIGHFNSTNSIVDILNYYSAKYAEKGITKYTFIKYGRGNKAYYAHTPPPSSANGSITVDIAKNTSWHFSSSDPLYTDGDDNPGRKPQNPFNIYCELEHDGDVTAAVAALHIEAKRAKEQEYRDLFEQQFKEKQTQKGLEELQKHFEEYKKLFDDLSGKGESETPKDETKDEGEPNKEKRHPFAGYTLDELDTIPPTPWLIEGLFSRQEVGIIYGDSSVGKSFTAIDLAMNAISQGMFANRFKVTEPLKVVYCAGEGKSKIHERIKAARDYYKISPETLKAFTLVKNVPILADKKSVDSFIDYYRDANIGLVIFDTLNKTTSGLKENDTDEMAIAINNGAYISEQLNCTVIFLHHENKGGDMRGSIVLRTNTDFIFRITRKGDTETRTLSCVKLKDGDEWSKVNFELVKPDFDTPSVVVKWEENKANSVVDKESSGKDLSKEEQDQLNDYKIIKHCEKYPNEWFTPKQLIEATGIASATLYRRLAKLAANKRLDTALKKDVGLGKTSDLVYKSHKIDFMADDE